jgi:DUF4097 and DUF4098 domain-containing protein YvlB
MVKAIMLFTVAALAVFPAAATAASETFEWAGGAAATELVISNASGDVNVTVAGDEVAVKATKSSPRAGDLADVKIKVEEKGEAVRVWVEYPDDSRRGHGVRVDFDVTVPPGVERLEVAVASGNAAVAGVETVAANVASGNLKISDAPKSVDASVASGELSVKNAGRATEKLDLNTVSGRLAVEVVLPAAGAEYELAAVSGDVSLTLLGGADNYDLSASTISGDVKSTLPLNVRGGFVGSRYEGRAGAATNVVRVSAVSGSVSISSGSK